MKKLSIEEFSKKVVEVLPQVIRGIMRRQSDALSRGKITAPQYLVLDLLEVRGPQTMSSLAKEISTSLPAMSGLVDRLHRMGLVKRRYGQKDRRTIKIDLKTEGRNVVKTIQAQRRKMFTKIFGELR